MYYLSRNPYGANVRPIINYSDKEDEEQCLYPTANDACRRSHHDHKNDVNVELANRNSDDTNMLGMCIGIFICIFFFYYLPFRPGIIITLVTMTQTTIMIIKWTGLHPMDGFENRRVLA